jgi:aminoglycoside phosphotransferase (APT) family kinase protein
VPIDARPDVRFTRGTFQILTIRSSVARMTVTPPTNTREPREQHRIDEAKLARWLNENVAKGDVLVRQFKGGQSNPTYWIGVGDVEVVLRKKPPGNLLPSAHAVEREYRVMRALAKTDVPVPDALALCEDESVAGKPFFVMRYVPSRIFWDPQLPEAASSESRAAIYRDYIATLAKLHKVDFAAVGLGDYGKIGGYVPRQVERWSKQYEASRTDDVPAMEALMKWLREKTPASDETTLIHGDYRMDNLLFSKTEERVLAVVDWELSTLGHPVSDLAYACMGYHFHFPGRGGLAGADVKALGIPTENEMVDAYCKQTGRTRIDDWGYHMAFGIFRLAAIAQGVYKRSLQGNASSDDAGSYGNVTGTLAELACEIAQVPVRQVSSK